MNGIEKLIAALRRAGLVSQEAEAKLAGEDIADLLWFLQYVHQKQGPRASKLVPDNGLPVQPGPPSIPFSQDSDEKTPEPLLSGKEKKPGAGLERDTTRHIYLPSQRLSEQGGQNGLLFRSPAAAALPQSLAIARALRPLMRRIPSRTNFLLDESATAQRIAETEKTTWEPVLRPAPMRWLEIALIADIGASMIPWRQTIDELRILLENHGAFRDVRMWRLATDEGERASLYAGSNIDAQQEREPGELIDSTGRRLILVVSDAVSPAWHSGKVQELLDLWGQNNIVTLVQVFPKRLWSRTTLSNADIVDVHAPTPNRGNAGLIVRGEQMDLDFDEKIEASLPIPIVTLEPAVLANWAQMIVGAENAWTLGALFYQNLPSIPEEASIVQARPTTPRDLVRQFRATASSTASKLLSLLSAAPISFPVIRLVQQALLPQANQVHIAEIFLSGLLKEISRGEATNDPDAVEYDFLAGVREVLHESIPIPSEFEVIEAVSSFLGSRYGTLREFYALASSPAIDPSNELYIGAESRPFARIVASAWRHIGGMYDAMADNLEQYVELRTEEDRLKDVDEAGSIPVEGERKPPLVPQSPNTLDTVEEPPVVQSNIKEEDEKNTPKIDELFQGHFTEFDSVLELWKSTQERVAKREKTSFELVTEQLEQTGWLVQDSDETNLTQKQGVAVRHDPSFPNDYILYIDQEVVGVVKVHQIGEALAGIEEPISFHKLKSNGSKRRDTAMFVYESTGKETRFSSYIEPEPLSRSVFTFHRPETLALWISQAPPDAPGEQNNLLRSRLRRMPTLTRDGLREYQFEAIHELERSLARYHKHSLLQMIVNIEMVYPTVNSIHRLLRYGGARRILYVFESSISLNYALNILEKFVLLDSKERFSSLYRVHNLRNGTLDQDANVCIGTFAELSAIYYAGDSPDAKFARMYYSSVLPIEYFDVIFIGACISSNYSRWRPLIEYFEAFIIGIGYDVDYNLRGMFDNNVVYTQGTTQPHIPNVEDEMREGQQLATSKDYPDGLTKREVHVLCLLAQGLTNAAIAELLGISVHMVEAHVSSIYIKSNLRSRHNAASYVAQHHLYISSGESTTT